MKPNVIVFLADDLGWGDLGCYGAEHVRTPNIDGLAERGLRYLDSHAVSSVCTPSRYGLLTGRYPWRSPLKSGVLGGTDPSILEQGIPTLAHLFKKAGYRTGAFGKWHLGLDWTWGDGSVRSAFDGEFRPDMQADGREVDYSKPFRNGPLDHGFDRFFGIPGSLDMPPYCFLDQDRTVGVPDQEKDPLVTSQRPGLTVDGWRDEDVDPTFVRMATEWISESGKPFFAYVASSAPHRPCVPPGPFRGTSPAGARGDSIHLVDWMVGTLVSSLSEAQLLNTIIVFTSDNGAPTIFPEDGNVTDYPPNGDWRGQKADAYEAGHRVPLIIAGPGVPAGGTSDSLVSLMDILPTFQTLLGEPISGDGSPLPLSELGGAAERSLAASAFDGRLVVRQNDDKVIYGTGSGGFTEPVGEPITPGVGDGQFYNLATDAGEQANIWSERRQEAERIYQRFLETTGFGMDNS